MANSSNDIRIVISAEDKASRPLRQLSKEVDNTTERTSRFSQVLSRGFKVATGLAVAGTLSLSGGLSAAAKASYDQVKAVEEARYGLLAYEKDGKKVHRVLGDLVSYAQSDMGVLFNRKDMFAAASTLKMYGNETETLTERVKILSKGVSQGKTTFQELSAIVGRAAAKGRLDAVDFDMLIERGIGLDRKFRGAKVSAEDLWKELNRALPDKLLKGRADTIEGRLIRLQSSFRGVGDAVLGVDKQTSNFIEGGLGDRIQKGVLGLTDFLRGSRPVVESAVRNLLGTFDLLNSGDFKKGMFASSVQEDSAYVDVLLNIRRAAMDLYNFMAPKFRALGDVISTRLVPAFQLLWTQGIQPLIPLVGVAFAGALGLAVDALTLGVQTLSTFVQIMTPFAPMIFGAVSALYAYRGAMVLVNGVNMLTAAYQAATNTQYMLYNGVLIKARASTVAQTVAQGALNTVMRLNPVGLLVSAVVGLGAALLGTTQQSQATTDALGRQRTVQDLLKESTDRLKDAQVGLKDAKLSKEQADLRVEDAERRLREILETNGRKSYEYRRANLDLRTALHEREKAASRVKDEEKRVNDETVQNIVHTAMAGKTAKNNTGRIYVFGQGFRDVADNAREANKELDKFSKKQVPANPYPGAGGSGSSWSRGPQGGIRALGNAVGSNNHPGGWSWVGEHGPELVRMPRGAQITPAYQSRQEGSPEGRSRPTVVIENYNSYNERDDKKLFDDLGFALENYG